MNFRWLIGFLVVLGCVISGRTQQPLEWARGIVWYQIFPERFHNGLRANDPTPAEVPEADLEPGWQVHPWTSDWYEMQPWELKRSRNFYDVVFTRRYGGDLIGVIQKLPYLKELGVDAIYFNPIFEAPSLHKYDGASFHHVDDNFGPDPAGDKARLAAANETEDPATWIWTAADSTFLELIQKAHELGIKIVIDGVFNHSGREFFAFKDIIQNGPKSRYRDWYTILRWDNPETPQDELDYKAWWGFKSLPEFAEDANGLKPGPREYIFHITRRWMDPNGDGDPSDGVDGWRLDVAEEVAAPFWREWYRLVKSINPEAITVAEIWHDASEWIHDRRMDATMNYLFARATVKFFINRTRRISGVEFGQELQSIVERYGEAAHILWNLIDSHDTDRLASMIINPDRDYDRQAGPRDNPNYDVRKPREHERAIQKQIVVLQMTFVGAPMIYYGDEAGMWGADDPDDRKPMVWPEMQFEAERHHPLPGHTRPVDPNGFDHQLFQFYQKMIALRHRLPALQNGSFQLIPEACTETTLGFKRVLGQQEVVVLFNASDQPVTLQIPGVRLGATEYRDALNETRIPVQNFQQLKIAPRGYRIFISADS